MFIYSLKGSTLKFIAVIIVSVGLLITLVSVIPSGESVSTAAAGNGRQFRNIKTNEERIALLSHYGWEVSAEPVEVIDVIIPHEFDMVYTKYNGMQRNQSLNLEKFRGRTVKRYTYTITNYPEYDGVVYANLLAYRDDIIGADICTAAVNGFMHGLEKDNRLVF